METGMEICLCLWISKLLWSDLITF